MALLPCHALLPVLCRAAASDRSRSSAASSTSAAPTSSSACRSTSRATRCSRTCWRSSATSMSATSSGPAATATSTATTPSRSSCSSRASPTPIPCSSSRAGPRRSSTTASRTSSSSDYQPPSGDQGAGRRVGGRRRAPTRASVAQFTRNARRRSPTARRRRYSRGDGQQLPRAHRVGARARLGPRPRRRVDDRRRRRRLRADHSPLRPRRRGAARGGARPLRPHPDQRQGGALAELPLNARSETAATRSTFKNAFAQRQWCIIPAQCLYVPHYAEGAKRAERWRIRRNDRSPLSIAGPLGPLGRRTGPRDHQLRDADDQLRPASAAQPLRPPLNDKGEPAEKRTPVLLAEEDFDEWLDASPGAGADLLRHLRQGRPRRRAGAVGDAPRRRRLMPLDTTISEF